eukprot:7380181-Prymnesium_polylepis.1
MRDSLLHLPPPPLRPSPRAIAAHQAATLPPRRWAPRRHRPSARHRRPDGAAAARRPAAAISRRFAAPAAARAEARQRRRMASLG